MAGGGVFLVPAGTVLHKKARYGGNRTALPSATVCRLIVIRLFPYRSLTKRKLTNAVLYLVDSGCKWRQLPHDFPPYPTVHGFYRRARLSGLRDGIMKRLVIITRKNAGRNKTPTYAIIDSQSVKRVASGEERGFDGEKMKERKRRIVIVSGGQDSLGLSFTPRTFMTWLPESMRR